MSIVWGKNLKVEIYEVDSADLNLARDDELETQTIERPMSEAMYNCLSSVSGFLSANHGNYRSYVVNFFTASPPPTAPAAAYDMMKTRKAELDALAADKGASVFALGQARRAVALAREAFGWAGSADYAVRARLPALTLFDPIDYYEPWRVHAGLDLWVLPKPAVPGLVDATQGELVVNPMSISSVVEIVITSPTMNGTLFHNTIDADFATVATMAVRSITKETHNPTDVTGDDALVVIKASNQSAKAQDAGGECYFDLTLPRPNPMDDVAFWSRDLFWQMNVVDDAVASAWESCDVARAILACQEAKLASAGHIFAHGQFVQCFTTGRLWFEED